MTIAITHPFVSAKGDGTDATLVRPSNWNAAHSTSMASGNLIGRQTAGAGAFEEIALSAFVAAALGSADAATFLAALGIGAFTTGDTKASINPTAAAGWVTYAGTGTIGDATSGGTIRANADCSALYQLIWNQISSPSANAFCPVTGGLGANAAADFAAHKAIGLPWFSGRSIIGAGAGGMLTTRLVGQYLGEETHVLSIAELATHYHSAGIYDPTHTHSHNLEAQNSSSATGGGSFPCSASVAGTITAAATGVRVNSSNGLDTTYSTGSSTAHNNMQPSIPLWIHVKL